MYIAWETRKHITTEQMSCKYMNRDTYHCVHRITVKRAVTRWKLRARVSIIFHWLIL